MASTEAPHPSRVHMTRVPDVEGYTDAVSYRPGDTVSVRCASRSARFDVRVTRVGAERRPMLSLNGVAGVEQEVPERAWADGCGERCR